MCCVPAHPIRLLGSTPVVLQVQIWAAHCKARQAGDEGYDPTWVSQASLPTNPLECPPAILSNFLCWPALAGTHSPALIMAPCTGSASLRVDANMLYGMFVMLGSGQHSDCTAHDITSFVMTLLLALSRQHECYSAHSMKQIWHPWYRVTCFRNISSPPLLFCPSYYVACILLLSVGWRPTIHHMSQC